MRKTIRTVNREAAPAGHGVLLWFEVNDFDSVVERARRLQAEILLEPHVNPAPQHREIWLRDADGYVVVIASPDRRGRRVSSLPSARTWDTGLRGMGSPPLTDSGGRQ